MKRYLPPIYIALLALLFIPVASYCKDKPAQTKAKKTVVSPTLNRSQAGLRIYKPDKCYQGYTLVSHGQIIMDRPEISASFPIYLIDMKGNTIYQWMADTQPKLVRLRADGHLFYIDGFELKELDMQSNVKWRYSACSIGHAFDFAENGNFIIDRDGYLDESSKKCYGNDGKPTDKVRIEIINPDKQVLWSWSGEDHQEQILKLSGADTDLSRDNNNHCEILKSNPLARKDKRFSKGNILFSYNSASLIGIIKYPKGDVVWAWGWGNLDGQHAPVMLDNGNLLIFDNGRNRGWARVIELNPLTEEIVWEYHAQPKEDFYVKIGGNAQRLPNGNTLICEGWRNRIFEITPDGEVVWDFISEFNKLGGQGNIYEAFRYPEEYARPLQKKVNQTLNGILGEYGVEFGRSGYLPVLKDFGFIAKDKYFRSIVAQKGKTRIEIEIIKPLTKDEATDYSMVKYLVIKNLYGPQMIPYQGTITTTTDCPAEKKPEETKVTIAAEEKPVLIASATERYTLGVWDDALIKQKAAFTVFYDQGKSILYRVLIFQPVGSFNREEILEILESIKITP